MVEAAWRRHRRDDSIDGRVSREIAIDGRDQGLGIRDQGSGQDQLQLWRGVGSLDPTTRGSEDPPPLSTLRSQLMELLERALARALDKLIPARGVIDFDRLRRRCADVPPDDLAILVKDRSRGPAPNRASSLVQPTPVQVDSSSPERTIPGDNEASQQGHRRVLGAPGIQHGRCFRLVGCRSKRVRQPAAAGRRYR